MAPVMAHLSVDGAGSVPSRRAPGGPAKGDRRRHAIVDAMERLLHDHTIADLSVEDIAAAAGISRSGFYFYFESKYAALGDALAHVGDEMAQASDEFFGGTDLAPEEYLPRALGGVANLWLRHTDLMVGVVDAAHSDTGVRELWDAWQERFLSAIRDRIAAERRAGRAPDGPPEPRDLARALLLMNLAVLHDDGRRRVAAADAERSIDALTRVWLSAVWGMQPAS
jgi:AcrR family transcriptional regulator